MEKYEFEFNTDFGVFRDAIHLPENHTVSNEEIELMKQQRLNNWLAVVNPPPSDTPPVIDVPSQVAGDTIEIAGETYRKLEGVPASGMKLVEVSGVWYYKV